VDCRTRNSNGEVLMIHLVCRPPLLKYFTGMLALSPPIRLVAVALPTPKFRV
jgi:hypothetical protein